MHGQEGNTLVGLPLNSGLQGQNFGIPINTSLCSLSAPGEFDWIQRWTQRAIFEHWNSSQRKSAVPLFLARFYLRKVNEIQNPGSDEIFTNYLIFYKCNLFVSDRFTRGVYAISVAGRLPNPIIREMKSRGITYRSRDTSLK